jgi:hypothetical protein
MSSKSGIKGYIALAGLVGALVLVVASLLSSPSENPPTQVAPAAEEEVASETTQPEPEAEEPAEGPPVFNGVM